MAAAAAVNNVEASLSMSLEDIIKSNKKTSGAPDRRAPAAGVGGPVRRNFKRSGNRPPPAPAAKAPMDAQWQHDMYRDEPPRAMVAAAGGVRLSSIETGTKLYVSNLDYGVSNEDIKELFSEIGDLKRSSIHYDRSGRSKGTAEVVFARRTDALAAVKKYNNVQLDGKPMKIEIVGTNIGAAAATAAASVASGGFGNAAKSAPRRAPAGAPRYARRGRGGRREGRGRGRGQSSKPVSAEELDADLEKYHAAPTSMEIS